jgi:hypothetical protein
MVAEIVCPWMVRVGKIDGGGKWVCNPWQLPEKCVIYSIGVVGDISFEKELDDIVKHRCKFYTFDSAPQGALLDLTSKRISFTQLKVALKTSFIKNEYTFGDVMKRFKHSFVDFLKIDVESTFFREYRDEGGAGECAARLINGRTWHILPATGVFRSASPSLTSHFCPVVC